MMGPARQPAVRANTTQGGPRAVAYPTHRGDRRLALSVRRLALSARRLLARRLLARHPLARHPLARHLLARHLLACRLSRVAWL